MQNRSRREPSCPRSVSKDQYVRSFCILISNFHWEMLRMCPEDCKNTLSWGGLIFIIKKKLFLILGPFERLVDPHMEHN